MPGLIARVQRNTKQILTGSFSVPVIFAVTGNDMVVTKTVNALAMKNHTMWDGGIRVDSKNTRITVSELALRELNYPVRDTNNEVNLIGHTVTWTDVSGVQATYIITRNRPDEVTGLILCYVNTYAVVTPPGRLIIGWIASRFDIQIAETPNPAITQVLANGDEIASQYALNLDGTLTIPYLVGYHVLTPFIIDNGVIQQEAYDIETGTFNNNPNGGFVIGNNISFNATIPIWQS